jgi:hypothetical protein
MASIEHDVPVRLYIFGMPRGEGTARVRTRDPAERAARAVRAAGICILLAAISILLPIAHFVLVPAFLIAAPVVAVRRLRERASIVALTGTCPRCAETRMFEVKGPFGKDVHTSCATCSFAIEVERDEPA